MPSTITLIAEAAAKVGFAVGGGVTTTGGLIGGLVAYGTTYVALTAALAYAANELLGPKNPATPAAGRDVTVRSAVEPRKIVYGRALISGPVVYHNVRQEAGIDVNNELWHVIALAGHEVTDWYELHLDGDVIPRAQFSAAGNVTSGDYFVNGTSQVGMHFAAGTDTQAAMPELLAAFPADWNATRRGQSVCYIATRFTTGDDELAATWSNGPPRNIRLLVDGKKIYDPRRDPTSPAYGGTGAQVLGDLTTYEFNNNPVLCTVDYLTESRLGMGLSTDRIDWESVAVEADFCDEMVDTPVGMQRRFQVNGTLHTGADHRENLKELLKSFNGRITYSGDKFLVLASRLRLPVGGFSLNEDDLISSVDVSTGLNKQYRYNTVTSIYIDPLQEYEAVESPAVSLLPLLARDNNEVLNSEQRYALLNDNYQAQRTAFGRAQIDNRNIKISATFNMKAFDLIVHDTVFITIEELGFSNKLFEVIEWGFVDTSGGLGVSLTLLEDDGQYYAEPLPAEYAAVFTNGVVSQPGDMVPAPNNVQATGQVGGIEVTWDNRQETAFYDRTRVYCASPQGAGATFATADVVFEGNASSYFSPFPTATSAEYWVVHVDQFGNESATTPGNVDVGVTATSITVVTGAALWSDPESKSWLTFDAGATYTPPPFTFNTTAEATTENGVTTVPVLASLNTGTGDITVTVGPATGTDVGDLTVSFNGGAALPLNVAQSLTAAAVDITLSHVSGSASSASYFTQVV